MRDGWVETTLDGIAEYINGYPFKPADLGEVGLPVIRIKQLLDPNEPVDRTETDTPDRCLLRDGDIVFSWSGTLAVRIWNRGPAKLNQHLFRVVEKKNVYKGIIPLILDHAIEELEEKSHGTTMKHITKQTLLPHKVLLPPLPEQKRIVDIIASVDSYIEAIQQQLVSIQSIRSSIAESLWSSFSLRSKLSSFGETLTGSTPPTKKKQYWESHEVDFFTPSDLGTSLKLNTAGRGVSSEGAAISRPLKGFSVLQVCIGATIGKVGYLNHPAVMNQQINALTNLTEHDAPILAAILSSETFQSIIRNTAGGSTLPIISKSSWGEIQIPHVPEGERIKVSLAILESDIFIEQSRQLLFSAEKLRNSILHNLLTGTHEIPAGYDKVIGAA